MTENKRWKIIDEQFISYYGGDGHKISNGECGFWLWHSKEDSQKVCDKLNELHDENVELQGMYDAQRELFCQLNSDKNNIWQDYQDLKKENDNLIHLLENQSMIIHELHSKLMHHQLKEPIALTKEDLEVMGKAISYYSHGRYVE